MQKKQRQILPRLYLSKKNYTRKCIRAGSYKPSRQLLHIHRIKKSVSTLLNALQKRKKKASRNIPRSNQNRMK